jgi:hypothetical protein
LELGDFAEVREILADYVESLRDYKTNLHDLEPELQAEIRQRWAPYIERYGY